MVSRFDICQSRYDAQEPEGYWTDTEEDDGLDEDFIEANEEIDGSELHKP